MLPPLGKQEVDLGDRDQPGQKEATPTGCDSTALLYTGVTRRWPSLASRTDSAAKDDLHDRVIRLACKACSEADVELPVRAEVHVRRGKDLLLRLYQGVKVGHRPERAVVFQRRRELPRHLEHHLRVGREGEACR